MPYTLIGWETDQTPLSANNFNHMEAGIKEAIDFKDAALDFFYPVGSVYITAVSQEQFDPNTVWGGTWVREDPGTVIVSAGTAASFPLGTAGGRATPALVAHNHTTPAVTITGGDHVHPIGRRMDNTIGNSAERMGNASTTGNYIWPMPAGFGGHTHTVPALNTNTIGTDASQLTTANYPPYKTYNVWRRTA